MNAPENHAASPLKNSVYVAVILPNLLVEHDAHSAKMHMRFSLGIDHIAVVARSLDEGTTYVESILGVRLLPGGKHRDMGTHNRLLALGSDTYLEVIAVDPAAPKPPHPRWFDMDSYDGPPRLTNWVCATDDLTDALRHAPPGTGEPMMLQRGDLEWSMAVPKFGRLPFDGAMPALIDWGSTQHHARRLPDYGLRLMRLDVFHPEAGALLDAFPALVGLDRVAVREGPEKRLIATISTPEGDRILA